MNIEREIITKLFESKYEHLVEAEFEINGKVYKSYFGRYTMDGDPITREEYFKAKELLGDKSNSQDDKDNPKLGKLDYDERTEILMNKLNDFTEVIKEPPVKPDGKYSGHSKVIVGEDNDDLENYLIDDFGYDNESAKLLSEAINIYSGDNEQPKGIYKDLFNDYLNELPVFYDGNYLYRGMSFGEDGETIYKELVNSSEGDQFKLHGYTSFSSNPRVSVDFAINSKTTNYDDTYRVLIVNSRNLTGKSLKAVSSYPSEDEVLYKPDARLVIRDKKVMGNWLFLHVEEGDLQEDEDGEVFDIGLEGNQHIYD